MTEQSFEGHRAISVRRLPDHVGQTVLVQGWLYNMRSKGKLHFLQVRDGTGIVQAVMFKGDVEQEDFEAASKLTQESSLRVIGEVKADERAQSGVELKVKKISVVHTAEPYPITPKEHGTAFLMEHRHLWLRSKKQTAIMHVRDEAIRAIREFFHERDFACVDSPMFTPNACEGTTTLFEVEYFGDKAFLTQSGQLYGEASAMALGKVYVFGPTFRAEKSKTRRHLTEFWMVEPEAAFYDLDDVMELAESMVATMVRRVLDNCLEDLQTLGRDIEKLRPAAETPYPRVTYDEAVDKIHAAGLTDFPRGEDFGAPHETALGEAFDRPVLVHRWPAAIKAFYMKRDPQNAELALGVDMIASEGYGELVGGAQREDDLDALEQRIAEHELPPEAFRWYTDLRRFGSVPHGGFGLGLERTIAWICGVEHLRECIPYPRMLYKIYP
ncbi:MAG: asparagine--tRNA ligase [Planctomycetota bacterium]|nr:asparagine--tRNA ligase [Planctomycetota bacterium]